MNKILRLIGAAVLSLASTGAHAALVDFQSYNGAVGLSTDGFGSLSNMGTISAGVTSDAAVVAAFLYTSTFTTNATPSTVTFEGNAITYDTTVPNATACCNLASHRADITDIVKPIIDGGNDMVYDFDIAEGANGGNIDGHALVVVYEDANLPEASIGILDGFADVTGDTTAINFADPLEPAEPGFFAEMVLGIGFSCCVTQQSNVEVNGELLTEFAGNKDDGLEGNANGNLITVGSFDDPFSPPLPNYEEDTERYDLSSFINDGDTSITVETFNTSQDDNIFLAAFYVSGRAGFNAPPPPPMDDPVTDPDPMTPPTGVIPLPASAWMLLAALGGLGLARRRAA